MNPDFTCQPPEGSTVKKAPLKIIMAGGIVRALAWVVVAALWGLSQFVFRIGGLYRFPLSSRISSLNRAANRRNAGRGKILAKALLLVCSAPYLNLARTSAPATARIVFLLDRRAFCLWPHPRSLPKSTLAEAIARLIVKVSNPFAVEFDEQSHETKVRSFLKILK